VHSCCCPAAAAAAALLSALTLTIYSSKTLSSNYTLREYHERARADVGGVAQYSANLGAVNQETKI
jgi:hypothetical protein